MSTDALSPEVQVAIARVRDEVAALHTELVRYGLVVWTGGNVSGRVPGADLFVVYNQTWNAASFSDLGTLDRQFIVKFTYLFQR